MFWMSYKENSFPIRTLIWRPENVFVILPMFVLLSCQPRVTVTYILFTIAKYNTIVYTSLELTGIEILFVY